MARVKASPVSADTDLTDCPIGAVGRRLARDLAGTTGVHVVGITAEPIIADASPVMVVCDAEGVGSAERPGASVDALPGVAVLDLGADLVVAAVGVVVALGHG